jgi:hypothetical protein
MSLQTRKYTIGLSGMLAAVVVILATSVPANQAQARAPWPCGPTGNEYTCYDLPCKDGDTQSNDTNSGESHCVGDKALIARPAKKDAKKTSVSTDKKSAPAVR